MHRHGYKGRKFHRETDQRAALMKGLAISLIEHEKIETTLPKAKDLRPFVEKLVTKAKQNDLHARRQIMAILSNKTQANKLVDEIAPKLADRQSGYLRIKTTVSRRGDNAQLATIEFVDNLRDLGPMSDSSLKEQTSSKADKPESAVEPVIESKAVAKEQSTPKKTVTKANSAAKTKETK